LIMAESQMLARLLSAWKSDLRLRRYADSLSIAGTASNDHEDERKRLLRNWHEKATAAWLFAGFGSSDLRILADPVSLADRRLERIDQPSQSAQNPRQFKHFALCS